MDQVNLTEPTRLSLIELQRLQALREQTTNRLSTGLRVQSAVDDPVDFFQARSLANRSGDISGLRDGIGQALSAVDASLAGVDAIEDLTQQLKGLALSARGASADQRAAIAEQFDSLRDQINNLAGDVSYQGVNLLDGTSGSLDVTVGDISGGEVSVEGSLSDATGLGIGPSSDFNGFATDADIDNALSQINGAIEGLRSTASQFANNVATLNIRDQFSENLTNTLDEGVAKLVNADINEEAANLVAIQVRDQLAGAALGVATQSEGAVLDILNGGR